MSKFQANPERPKNSSEYRVHDASGINKFKTLTSHTKQHAELNTKASIKSIGKINPHKVRDWIVNTTILLVLVLGVSFGWLNIKGYIHPFPFCKVRIHTDLVSGDKQSIKQAIRILRREDKPAYKVFCQEIDRIYEEICIGSDWHLNAMVAGEDEPGCYVKGSRVIYIKPNTEKDTALVLERSQLIKKYSELAREFWRDQN